MPQINKIEQLILNHISYRNSFTSTKVHSAVPLHYFHPKTNKVLSWDEKTTYIDRHLKNTIKKIQNATRNQ